MTTIIWMMCSPSAAHGHARPALSQASAVCRKCVMDARVQMRLRWRGFFAP
jgi:hypothetical protein